MSILVTGLDGFTGQYVKTELEKAGQNVIGLASDLTNRSDVTAEVLELQPKAVIHLAAIAFVDHGNVDDIYNVNLIGTRNLLHALSQSTEPINHVLLASSANIYGNVTEGSLNESMPANPANDYAISKYAMERMASLWSEQLPISISRPFNYTGVGQDEMFLIPKVVSHFKHKKQVIELGNLDVWREFNDVRFVANAYSKLIETPPSLSGSSINICTGVSYSLREAIAICEKITGHGIDIKINPEYVRTNDVRVLKGDDTLLKSIIGDANTYSLEETLIWMLDS